MESRVGSKSSRCKVHYSLDKDDKLFGERSARLDPQYGMESGVGGKSSMCKVPDSLDKDDTFFGEWGARLGPK